MARDRHGARRTFRLSIDLDERIAALAQRRGLKVSAVLRRLVDASIAAGALQRMEDEGPAAEATAGEAGPREVEQAQADGGGLGVRVDDLERRVAALEARPPAQTRAPRSQTTAPRRRQVADTGAGGGTRPIDPAAIALRDQAAELLSQGEWPTYGALLRALDWPEHATVYGVAPLLVEALNAGGMTNRHGGPITEAAVNKTLERMHGAAH